MPKKLRRDCEHESFSIKCEMARIRHTDGAISYMLEVHVKCAECESPMQFLGLEPGMSMKGAMVSPDALEARLAMMPEGEAPNPMDVLGYKITAAEISRKDQEQPN